MKTIMKAALGALALVATAAAAPAPANAQVGFGIGIGPFGLLAAEEGAISPVARADQAIRKHVSYAPSGDDDD